MSASDPNSTNLKPPPETKEAMAVALEHERRSDRPPKVVAGGRGRIAEQILAIAFAQGVPVREDADLAQLLTSIDIDSEIPAEVFAAVAEILTYVYQVNNLTDDTEANQTNEGEDATGAGLASRWVRDPET